MTTLKDVAEKAHVTLRTAFEVLNNTSTELENQAAVLEAAQTLDYSLNITIRDVADFAKVSIATVSYVLNNSAPVSNATRQRVAEAVAFLGFRPNSTARNLRAHRTHMIGYTWHDLVPGQVKSILDRFVYGMARAVEDHGYHLLTFTQRSESAIHVYEELLHSGRVDGFVLSDVTHDDPRVRRLMELNAPFVTFGRTRPDWNHAYVDVESEQGIRMAVEHLVAQGHQRIGMLGFSSDEMVGALRTRAFNEAVQAAGLEMRTEWQALAPNTIDGGEQAATQVMAAPIRPTALVCHSDNLAVGAHVYLEQIGLRPGSHVALTGCDDDPMSRIMRPALTTVNQPVEQVAERVVDLLLRQIEKEPLTDYQQLLAPELIVRASSTSWRGEGV